MDNRMFSRIQQLISIGVGVIAVFAGFYFGAVSRDISDTTISKEVRITDIESEFHRLQDKVEKLDQLVQKLNSSFGAVSTALEKMSKGSKSLKNVNLLSQIEVLSSEIKAIRSALGSDLERSLSVPLLRKDLTQLQAQLNERDSAASKEIDRIYDQNKWFIGIMVTMAMGLLGLAVSNFLQSKKTNG